ncbi:hypothetical protein ABID16_002526 [Rhizobium aquaticum]|uniref:Uncharacterized protein n=1 Tax=Rhizobium aquaticum TaxID=1549636 RepID=A0ABV2J0C0_9HYPH
MAITTMIMTTGMTMDTAILTVMGIAIPIRTAVMITLTIMGTIMTTTTIMRAMTMCITRMARRITARALPAFMFPA